MRKRLTLALAAGALVAAMLPGVAAAAGNGAPDQWSAAINTAGGCKLSTTDPQGISGLVQQALDVCAVQFKGVHPYWAP